MQKITIVSLHLGVGGIEKYISGLCKMLKDNYKIHLVITYKLNEKPSFDIDKNIKITYLIDGKPNREEVKNCIKNKKVFSLVKELFKAVRILILKKIKTIKAIKSLDCDYVITTRNYETKLVNKYLKKSSIKKIATSHSFPTPKFKKELLKATTNFDKIVVVNDEIKDIYYKEIGNKVICINNFVEKLSKEMHNFNSKKLISVGRFSQEKGYDDLIDIMSLIVKKDKNVTLTLIGDGPEMDNIINKIKKLKLEKNINLTGYLNQDEIKSYLHESSMFLMTSHTEAFPLVLVEAMNYGLPIVAFDSASGARVVLKDIGSLIKNRNKEEFVNVVLDILNDKNKMKILSEKSKEEIKKYSIENIKKEYLNLLSSLENKSNKNIMFISSTGGHLNELLMLKDMFNKYDYEIITEKDPTNMGLKDKFGKKKVKYLIYATQKNKLTYAIKLLANCFVSLYYFIRFRPKFIISTGAHTTGPMCCIGKIFGSKIIFIETFANSKSKTMTGRIVYKFADLFIVQWESMLELYPNAVYGGWIY